MKNKEKVGSWVVIEGDKKGVMVVGRVTNGWVLYDI